MAAYLYFAHQKDGNVGAVARVETRIGIDVDLVELDAEAAQAFRHLVAEMAVGPA